MIYPETRSTDHEDSYFGTRVPDPYRWLEDDTSPETKEWVGRQNRLTSDFLDAIPFRDSVRERIKQAYDYRRLSAPFREGAYTYRYRNNGLQNHSVLYRSRGEDGEEAFLDPNTFSADGTIALTGVYFSKDGSLAAYLISEGGSDWRKAVVIETEGRRVLEPSLEHLKFTSIAWKGNDGFYYASYDKPEGSELSAKTDHHKVYYHRLGTSQDEDTLVFGGPDLPRRYVGVSVTEDERYLVLSAANSTSGNELYIRDLDDPGGSLRTIVDDMEYDHHVIDNDGTTLLIRTNLGAERSRIVAADLAATSGRPDTWRDLIPEQECAIERASRVGGSLFVSYLRDASTWVRQFAYDGSHLRDVELPSIGTAFGFSGKRHEEDTFYSFTAFTEPTTIYRFDLSSGVSELTESPRAAFDPADYETKQVFYSSVDGTRIPMFLVHRRDVSLDGQSPTLLYGYGGFNFSLKPLFSPARMVWLDAGGVYAQPTLRGGGEYGKAWHLAGTKTNKQNVFDDFIAAAEFLIDSGVTSKERLVISGGSNGGLLVGATMTQRPDLAAVALPAVGVLDMLRYHIFTAGAGWAYDYGTSEESREMFEYLIGYSPLHAIKEGVGYPATLVTTADHDDRVVPAHSFKFAATLQAAQRGEQPVLIKIDTRSGHGASNLMKSIETVADQYAFAWHAMGITPAFAATADRER